MKSIREENKPAAVMGKPSKQAGAAQEQWAKLGVWTTRMLAALENGVKGGKWFSLIDKVHSLKALELAYGQVKKNRGSHGVDQVTIARFEQDKDHYLKQIRDQIKAGTYEAKPVRRVYVPKGDGKMRPLGIPCVRDRVVQGAIRNAIEPIFDAEFCEYSYGFRRGKHAKEALRRVDELLKQGYTHVVDADLKSYFDTIPHDKLMSMIKERIADRQLLQLLEGYLKQGVMEEMERITAEEIGTPQGAVISPLLANLYLHPLDKLMEGQGIAMTRYADDFVIQCRSREEAERALNQVQEWVQTVGLILHPDKTRMVDVQAGEGFDFLGYHFERDGRRWPREKSMKKLKDTVRSKTKRSHGKSMPAIIRELNKTLVGWFEYFKHSNKRTFRRMDGWIRMRLRSILRKRNRRHGRGRGLDHQRWPNAYFEEMGLFAMYQAHAKLCQSR